MLIFETPHEVARERPDGLAISVWWFAKRPVATFNLGIFRSIIIPKWAATRVICLHISTAIRSLRRLITMAWKRAAQIKND